MATSNAGRGRRGLSTMRSPRKVILQERAAYEPRFGADFARRVTRGSWVVVASAWIMIVSLAARFIVGATVLALTRSTSSVYDAMYVGFGGIALGFLLNALGTNLRTTPIKEMSARIIAFDPKVTPDGAARLIRSPQLYDRWMIQHPGFVASR